MFCSSCGAAAGAGARFCAACGQRLAADAPPGADAPVPGPGGPAAAPAFGGAPAPATPDAVLAPMARGATICPHCGRPTTPVAYFARGTNVAKMVVLFPFTHVVGPLLFFLVRKDRFICTQCLGLLPPQEPAARLDPWTNDVTLLPPGAPYVPPGLDGVAPAVEGQSRFQLVWAWIFGSGALACVGTALANPFDAGGWMILSSLAGGLGLSAAFRAQRLARRAQQLRHDERTLRLLDLARETGGRLTVTAVAARFRVGFDTAERVLDSVVDGRRVDVEIDEEGNVTYVFRELARALPP